MIQSQHRCHPENYLKRAKHCLGQSEPEFLYYAALELRCFVEARQHQYLTAQRKYAKSMPRSWRIGQQGKELKRIYDLQKIQRLRMIFQDNFEFEFRYVPVSEILRNNSEKLGKLLHAQEDVQEQSHLEEMQALLSTTWEKANHCQSGNLLAPSLLDKSSGQPAGNLEAIVPNGESAELIRHMQEGAKMIVKVDYLEI